MVKITAVIAAVTTWMTINQPVNSLPKMSCSPRATTKKVTKKMRNCLRGDVARRSLCAMPPDTSSVVHVA